MPAWAAAAAAVACLGLGGAAAGWALRSEPSIAARELRTFDLVLDGMLVATDRPPVLSPNGSRIVYHSGGRLWIRSLAAFDVREVAGSEGAAYAAWSPDGSELAFVKNSKLFRVAESRGEPQLVGDVPADMRGSGALVWTREGNFVAVGSDTVGILAISARDGTFRELLTLDRKTDADFHELSLLPDGRSVLFTAHTNQGVSTIGALVGGQRRNVLTIPGENLRSVAYHPAGYILFGRETIQRGIWAVRFSVDSLTTEGDPFLVDPTGRYPTVAADGTLSIVRPSPDPSQLVWMDHAGTVTPAGTMPGRVPEYTDWPMLRLSPNAQRVAVALEYELWVCDLSRGVVSPLVRGVPRVISPAWSPDGSRLFFGGFNGGRAWSVNSVAATEAGSPHRVLPPSDEFQWPADISPDGRWLLFGQSFARDADLWLAPLDHQSEAKPLMVTPSKETGGQFSSDGGWLAYYSDESGRPELYLRRFPIGSDREMLSSGGASSIQWARNGREIFYRSGPTIMSVRLTGSADRLTPSPPERLLTTNDAALSQSFAVSNDGQRFLFARAVGTDRVGLILNWPPAER